MSKDDNFFNKLDTDDSYYIALMLLYFLKDDPKYSTLSELVYLVDRKSFLNLIQYYGGQDIAIPDSEEVILALKTLMLYQYRVVNKLSWSEAIKKAGFNSSESAKARALYITLEQVIEKTKSGKEFIDTIRSLSWIK